MILHPSFRTAVLAAVFASFCAGFALAADIPGVPRDSNFNNTGGYDATRIVARLNVNVDSGTKVVHFIRDNNDPRVVTKTYLPRTSRCSSWF